MSRMNREYKVVILGSGGVGKSALTVKFVSGNFIERYDPTIEDFYRKEIMVDNAPATLEILDTAGTEQFASMRDLYIKNGHGFIVVFSVTSVQTFHDVRPLFEQIKRVKRTERPALVLVGNKADLEQLRQVPSQDGLALAQFWGCPFFETSARTSFNVDAVFSQVVKEMVMNQSSSHRDRKGSSSCCHIL